jgi:aquaporin Z
MFTIGQAVVEPGLGALAPLAIGAALIAMIYAGGHISGAHYNPAVTLAIFLRGAATGAEVAGYWLAQVAGAALAAFSVLYLKAGAQIVASTPNVGPALLAEFLFTFALVYVILNVATAKGTQGNSYFGLAIGLTVVAGAYAVGAISGAAFNPAVAIGITILGLSAPASIWIFLVADLLGGILAALVFGALNLGEDKPTNATPAEQAELEPAASTGR